MKEERNPGGSFSALPNDAFRNSASGVIQNSVLRNSSLDVIRTLAIILVVLNHAVEYAYPLLDPPALMQISRPELLFCYGMFTLGRIGVPLFILLSGYLLLPRDYFDNKEGVLNFYKKNLLPLLLTWEIWILLYNLLNSAMGIAAFSIKHYLAQAVFMEKVPERHSWYIPMILGMYLFLPFFSKILSLMKGRWIALLLGITYIYFFLVPFLEYKWPDLKDNLLNLNFSGGVYGLFLVLGYCVFRYEALLQKVLKPVYRRILLLLFALALYGFTTWFHLHRLNGERYFCVWYSFYTMPFIGLAVFLLVKQWNPKGRSRTLFREISLCSFGIYLLHVPVLQIFTRYLPEMPRYAVVFACLLVGFLISLLLATLIGRIAGGRVGKVLFLRKAQKSRKIP